MVPPPEQALQQRQQAFGARRLRPLCHPAPTKTVDTAADLLERLRCTLHINNPSAGRRHLLPELHCQATTL